jgi:hypothetical protein
MPYPQRSGAGDILISLVSLRSTRTSFELGAGFSR